MPSSTRSRAAAASSSSSSAGKKRPRSTTAAAAAAATAATQHQLQRQHRPLSSVQEDKYTSIKRRRAERRFRSGGGRHAGAGGGRHHHHHHHHHLMHTDSNVSDLDDDSHGSLDDGGTSSVPDDEEEGYDHHLLGGGGDLSRRGLTEEQCRRIESFLATGGRQARAEGEREAGAKAGRGAAAQAPGGNLGRVLPHEVTVGDILVCPPSPLSGGLGLGVGAGAVPATQHHPTHPLPVGGAAGGASTAAAAPPGGGGGAFGPLASSFLRYGRLVPADASAAARGPASSSIASSAGLAGKGGHHGVGAGGGTTGIGKDGGPAWTPVRYHDFYDSRDYEVVTGTVEVSAAAGVDDDDDDHDDEGGDVDEGGDDDRDGGAEEGKGEEGPSASASAESQSSPSSTSPGGRRRTSPPSSSPSSRRRRRRVVRYAKLRTPLPGYADTVASAAAHRRPIPTNAPPGAASGVELPSVGRACTCLAGPSPCGRYAALGDTAGYVTLYDLGTMTPVARLETSASRRNWVEVRRGVLDVSSSSEGEEEGEGDDDDDDGTAEESGSAPAPSAAAAEVEPQPAPPPPAPQPSSVALGKTPERTHSLSAQHDDAVERLAFSSDGLHVACATKTEVELLPLPVLAVGGEEARRRRRRASGDVGNMFDPAGGVDGEKGAGREEDRGRFGKGWKLDIRGCGGGTGGRNAVMKLDCHPGDRAGLAAPRDGRNVGAVIAGFYEYYHDKRTSSSSTTTPSNSIPSPLVILRPPLPRQHFTATRKRRRRRRIRPPTVECVVPTLVDDGGEGGVVFAGPAGGEVDASSASAATSSQRHLHSRPMRRRMRLGPRAVGLWDRNGGDRMFCVCISLSSSPRARGVESGGRSSARTGGGVDEHESSSAGGRGGGGTGGDVVRQELLLLNASDDEFLVLGRATLPHARTGPRMITTEALSQCGGGGGGDGDGDRPGGTGGWNFVLAASCRGIRLFSSSDLTLLGVFGDGLSLHGHGVIWQDVTLAFCRSDAADSGCGDGGGEITFREDELAYRFQNSCGEGIDESSVGAASSSDYNSSSHGSAVGSGPAATPDALTEDPATFEGTMVATTTRKRKKEPQQRRLRTYVIGIPHAFREPLEVRDNIYIWDVTNHLPVVAEGGHVANHAAAGVAEQGLPPPSTTTAIAAAADRGGGLMPTPSVFLGGMPYLNVTLPSMIVPSPRGRNSKADGLMKTKDIGGGGGGPGGVQSILFHSTSDATNHPRLIVTTQNGECHYLERSFKTDFAGPMFPPGYRVVSDNIDYVENEGEMDYPLDVYREYMPWLEENSTASKKGHVAHADTADGQDEDEDVDVVGLVGCIDGRIERDGRRCQTSFPPSLPCRPEPFLQEALYDRIGIVLDEKEAQQSDMENPRLRSTAGDPSQKRRDANVRTMLSLLPSVDETLVSMKNRRGLYAYTSNITAGGGAAAASDVTSGTKDRNPEGGTDNGSKAAGKQQNLISAPTKRSRRPKSGSIEAMLQASIDPVLRKKMLEREKWSDGSGVTCRIIDASSSARLQATDNDDVDAQRRGVSAQQQPKREEGRVRSEEIQTAKRDGKTNIEEQVSPPLVPCEACMGRMVVHRCGKRVLPEDTEALERAEAEKVAREKEEERQRRLERKRQQDRKRRELARKKREEEKKREEARARKDSAEVGRKKTQTRPEKAEKASKVDSAEHNAGTESCNGQEQQSVVIERGLPTPAASLSKTEKFVSVGNKAVNNGPSAKPIENDAAPNGQPPCETLGTEASSAQVLAKMKESQETANSPSASSINGIIQL